MSRKDKPQYNFKISDFAEKLASSGMDRRTFLMRTAMAAAAVSLPVTMCSPAKRSNLLLERDPAVLSEKEWQILKIVQEHLFPSEEDSPGAHDINAAAFVQWVLTDTAIDKREQTFLKEGLSSLDDDARERWSMPFLDMLPENQVKLLQHIESHEWGESWLSVMLMYIFEALLSDPVYGANSDEQGWQWLNYAGGKPEPEYRYSEVVKQLNS